MRVVAVLPGSSDRETDDGSPPLMINVFSNPDSSKMDSKATLYAAL
jgi:hypothetical protein